MNQNTNEPATAQRLSLFDGTMIIMGSMIGSGIFIVSADISRQVQTPGLLLLVWFLTGLVTILGALSYGELAAMYPKAGGQYVYLREAYNPLFGFLYGWTLFAVIQTGTIAAVGVAFAKFLGVFVHSVNDSPLFEIGKLKLTSQQLVGIAAIGFLTVLNFRGVKSGALVQNVLTTVKVMALAAVVLAGFWVGFTGNGSVENFTPTLPENMSFGIIGVVFTAMVGSLFSSDAWNNVTFTAGEMKNPQRNLPLSLAIGTMTVIGLYILANFTYIYVLGIDGIKTAESDRVGTALMYQIFGDSGRYWMACFIMISTFGCLNGMILSGARVYYAMAKDQLFLKQAKKLNASGVPAVALILQAVWACILTLSGSYNDLLDYVIFAVLIFYVLTVAGLLRLRQTQPQLQRPYKVIGYPFTPIIYILLASIISITLLINKPQFTFPGLLIVLLGIPVYYYFQKREKN